MRFRTCALALGLLGSGLVVLAPTAGAAGPGGAGGGGSGGAATLERFCRPAAESFKVQKLTKDSEADVSTRNAGTAALRASLGANAASVSSVFRDDKTGRTHVLVDDDAPAAAADAIKAAGPSLGGNVEVNRPCASKRELAASRARVQAWTAAAKPTHSATMDNVVSGQVILAIDKDQPEAGRLLADARATLGPGVDVVEAQGGLNSGRYDDATPHFGAAAIKAGGPSIYWDCSSGVTIWVWPGVRYMLTAGHCTDAGMPGNWFSGGQAYGNFLNRPAGYPDRDVALLAAPAGHSYTNGIWVDPCCPTTRRVTAQNDPVNTHQICMSGATSQAKCGLIVASDDETAEITDWNHGGTRRHMDIAVGPFANANIDKACYFGDSGGAYYYQNGSNATYAGNHVGGIDIPAYGVTWCYFLPPSQVLAAYPGIALLTTP